MTMGIVVVASFGGTGWYRTRCDDDVDLETHEFGRKRGEAIKFPSANRHSTTMFFPSTYSSSRSPCWNASMRAAWQQAGTI